jgi:hypothetical protein
MLGWGKGETKDFGESVLEEWISARKQANMHTFLSSFDILLCCKAQLVKWATMFTFFLSCKQSLTKECKGKQVVLTGRQGCSERLPRVL